MIDHHARHGAGLVQPADRRVLRIGAGIAARRHDHDHGRVGRPAQAEILQLSVAGGDQRRQQVGAQPRHQHLAFRVAEADIVLDQLRPLRRQHQPREEHAAEGRAAPRHLRQGRPDDPLHGLGLERLGEGRGGGIGAHAAGVRTGVAIADALVILRPDQGQGMAAVAEGEEGDLLADQAFLDQDRGARRAVDAAIQHVGDGGLGLLQRGGHHHALAGGEAVGLDHDRCALRPDIGHGLGTVGEAGPFGPRHAGGFGDLAGEALGALQPRRGGGGAEAADARLGAGIGQAQGQRRLGADHHEVHLLLLRQGELPGDVLGRHGQAFGDPRDPGVAGGHPEPGQQGGIQQLPGQGVLPPPAAHQQHLHRAISTSRPAPRERPGFVGRPGA
ncbi:hypothetical protein ROTAS13_04516 [Roseomonas sp. TAS13]|nr:hypothetical protein ROTAS13_04516 [Roseomonas sp. TAS13]